MEKTNIDYKKLGISKQANEFFEIYHEFLDFMKKLDDYINENEKWYDAVSNTIEEKNDIYAFYYQLQNVEAEYRKTARLIWNYETKYIF